MRFRITVRGTDIELRGYVDGEANLRILSKAMEGLGMVVASPAEPDYDPFRLFGIFPAYDGYVPGPVDELIQKRLTGELNGDELGAALEAYAKDQELRELHHFETEQILERIKAARSNGPECAVHPGDDEIICGWKMIVLDIDKALAAAK